VGILLGHAHTRAGNHDDADRELRDALAAMSELGSSAGRAAALGGLGELAEHAGRLDEARRSYEMALDSLGEAESVMYHQTRARLDRLAHSP
jgi:tetratricopeptide (TPR) repeat protein